jgi:hypothetical protein
VPQESWCSFDQQRRGRESNDVLSSLVLTYSYSAEPDRQQAPESPRAHRARETTGCSCSWAGGPALIAMVSTAVTDRRAAVSISRQQPVHGLCSLFHTCALRQMQLHCRQTHSARPLGWPLAVTTVLPACGVKLDQPATATAPEGVIDDGVPSPCPPAPRQHASRRLQAPGIGAAAWAVPQQSGQPRRGTEDDQQRQQRCGPR